jgi:acetyl esterase/lipase
VIVAHVLLVVLFALGGAISGFAGVMGLLLMAGSCAVLGNVYLDSGRSALIMERVLRDGLGDRYEDDVEAELRSKFERRVRWEEIARPFKFERPEVEVVRDIRFAREKGIDLKLDVLRHRMVTEKAPVLLQIHGGAWTIDYKEKQAQPLMTQLASRGWVCVNADYRLSPHATFPDHLVDCKRAIAWIKENVERYGGDPAFIVVTGGSAGGHLSTLVALTANDTRYQPGFEDVDTSVRACVPFYGIYDMADRHGFHTASGLPEFLEKTVLKGAYDEIPDLYRDASPLDLVCKDAPPFLVIHGDCDILAPVEDARVFVESLRRESESPVLYAELPGAQHGFDVFHCLREQHVIDAVERFVQAVYSSYLSSARPKAKARTKTAAKAKTQTSAGSPAKDTRKRGAAGSPAEGGSVANGKDRSEDAADGRVARLPRSRSEAAGGRAKPKSAAATKARKRPPAKAAGTKPAKAGGTNPSKAKKASEARPKASGQRGTAKRSSSRPRSKPKG